MDVFKTTITSCSRCGHTHNDILVIALLNPPDDSSTTHWATCPVTQQPILIRAERKEEKVYGQDERQAP